MDKQKKKATFLKETLIERTNMFQTVIQQLTDDHDQISASILKQNMMVALSKGFVLKLWPSM